MAHSKGPWLVALCALAVAAAALTLAWRAHSAAASYSALAPAVAPSLQLPPAASHRALATVAQSSTLSDVAEAAVQSVVNISTTKVTLQRPSRDEQFFRRLWGLGSGDREQQAAASLGSGVIVSADGVVLTNNHVIEGASAIGVRLADGREFSAQLIGADPRSDLAVLRLQGDVAALRPLPLADSDKVRLGEMVLAIGSPFGLAQSVSLGIVSAKGRADVNIADYEDFIQTDAAINPGNSGGALVNLRGELIGISTAIASSSGGSQGIGFAIPSNMVRPIMRSLLQNGRMVRGWLGVAIQTLTPELVKSFGVPQPHGVLIADVHVDSVAQRAGLQRGDVALKVGKTTVDSAQHFRNAIGQAGAGAKVAIELWRQGKVLTIEVLLAEAPDPRRVGQSSAPAATDPGPAGPPQPPPAGSPPPAGTSTTIAGMQVADINATLRATFAYPPELQGVVILDVADGSAVEAAGLSRADVVLEVDRQATRTVSALHKALKPGHEANLLVWRAGRASFVMVAVPKD